MVSSTWGVTKETAANDFKTFQLLTTVKKQKEEVRELRIRLRTLEKSKTVKEVANESQKDLLAIVMKQNDEMKEIQNKLKTIEQEFTLENVFPANKKKIDHLLSTLEKQQVEIQELQNKLKAIKQESAPEEVPTDNSTNYDGDILELQTKFRMIEQEVKMNDVRVIGIPKLPDEELVPIVMKVGLKLGIRVAKEDIVTVIRLPIGQKKLVPAVKVKFNCQATRELWLDTYRMKKPVWMQFCPLLPLQQIRVVEHLTSDNQQFFNKLKHRCTQLRYKFVWSRDGKFYAKRSESDHNIRIRTLDDIEQLK